tara:strand:+ start:319 stop:489 length:171 start_codon:yes stop_codon:yes gene_type:complete
MSLKEKYQKYKIKVRLAEKKRNFQRNSDSWIEIRRLKKEKLALKDALASQKLHFSK